MELWVNESEVVFLTAMVLSHLHAPSFLKNNLTHSSRPSRWGQEPCLAAGNGWCGQVLSQLPFAAATPQPPCPPLFPLKVSFEDLTLAAHSLPDMSFENLFLGVVESLEDWIWRK